MREGGQKGGRMAGLTGRLATCDQQVVEDQVPHVTSDADKTGLRNQARVDRPGLTAISPPLDLALLLRGGGGLSILPSIFLCVDLIRLVNY